MLILNVFSPFPPRKISYCYIYKAQESYAGIFMQDLFNQETVNENITALSSSNVAQERILYCENISIAFYLYSEGHN